ncbi:MAG: hypothetical protein ACXWIJ_08330, partial [Burkholderiales bacterium]
LFEDHQGRGDPRGMTHSPSFWTGGSRYDPESILMLNRLKLNPHLRGDDEYLPSFRTGGSRYDPESILTLNRLKLDPRVRGDDPSFVVIPDRR